jgi:tight adherence protein C
MTLLLGLLAIASALGLGVFVALGSRARTMTVTEGLEFVHAPVPIIPEPAPVPSLTRRMGALAARLMPGSYLTGLQHRLDLAGNPAAWPPERVLTVKGFGVVAGLVLGLMAGAEHGLPLSVLLAALFGAVGIFFPDLLVRSMGEKRQIQLQRRLPDAMDMLMVCVEAGMGFDAALGRVARNLDGPVAEECARVLQEMQFGMSRTEALRALVARTDVAELRAFVAAMVQSAELGISIGDVLREQSRQMRIKRRQRAEEKAQKLQVKLLMPLITCLLPAIFVVVLGPAIIHIAKFFSAAN